MPRGLAVLIVLVALVIGAMFLLSSRVQEQPLRTIETDVTANAAG
jgi:hypothetical protein